MNVFHRYTRQALRKNRSRTWVTIVGIILSVALFTAVTEGAYSGVQYLVGAAEYTVGRFHGCYQNLTEQQASQLSREEREITEPRPAGPALHPTDPRPPAGEGRGAPSAGASVVQWQRPPCAGGHHGAGAGPPDAGWGGADGR